MRIFSAFSLVVMLTACGVDADGQNEAAAPPFDAKTAPNGIDCAPPGQSSFARQCVLDRVADAEGTVLIARLPDGGFHRFRPTPDGRSVVAADGAEPAQVTLTDSGAIEVAIGGARYRLPAMMASTVP